MDDAFPLPFPFLDFAPFLLLYELAKGASVEFDSPSSSSCTVRHLLDLDPLPLRLRSARPELRCASTEIIPARMYKAILITSSGAAARETIVVSFVEWKLICLFTARWWPFDRQKCSSRAHPLHAIILRKLIVLNPVWSLLQICWPNGPTISHLLEGAPHIVRSSQHARRECNGPIFRQWHKRNAQRALIININLVQ